MERSVNINRIVAELNGEEKWWSRFATHPCLKYSCGCVRFKDQQIPNFRCKTENCVWKFLYDET